MFKAPCPFLGRLSMPFMRRNGSSLVDRFANVCPVASRMVSTVVRAGQTEGRFATDCDHSVEWKEVVTHLVFFLSKEPQFAFIDADGTGLVKNIDPDLINVTPSGKVETFRFS